MSSMFMNTENIAVYVLPNIQRDIRSLQRYLQLKEIFAIYRDIRNLQRYSQFTEIFAIYRDFCNFSDWALSRKWKALSQFYSALVGPQIFVLTQLSAMVIRVCLAYALIFLFTVNPFPDSALSDSALSRTVLWLTQRFPGQRLFFTKIY